MANSSRNPNEVLSDAEQKGYRRILFQQGKPLCDFELTLLGDLANPQRLAAQYIGSGVPSGADNGFAIDNLDLAASDFTIRAGRCLVNGNEVLLRSDTTYKTQPHREQVRPFPFRRNINVYLRTFPTEITDKEDEALQNKGDVGVATTFREKTDWEVLATDATINVRDHFLLASFSTSPQSESRTLLTDRRRKGLTMAALRDEFDALGGTSANLNDRLNGSLNPNGTLKDNIVGNAQLANNAVTLNKIADAAVTERKIADGSVSATKLAVNSVIETNLADNAVSKRTIQDGAISMTKLAPKPILESEVSVPRATIVSVPNQPPVVIPGEKILELQTTDEHAFYLISVRLVSPRPLFQLVRPGEETPENGVRWMQRSFAVSLNQQGTKSLHQHQLLIQNFNPKIEFTVACKAFRIADV